MVKVKARYHFLDTKACRNRMQGNVFEVSEERAKELVKTGLVMRLDTGAKEPAQKPVGPTTTGSLKKSVSPAVSSSKKPTDRAANSAKKQSSTKTQNSPKE